MFSPTLVQPMEKSEAVSKKISKVWPIAAYSLGRKHMDIQPYSTCKIRERCRDPPELEGLTSRGDPRDAAGCPSLSLLPALSPKWDVWAWSSRPWTPCRWWSGQPPEPWGQHVLSGLVWPCCGFPAGTAESLPCIRFTDPHTVLPSGF